MGIHWTSQKTVPAEAKEAAAENAAAAAAAAAACRSSRITARTEQRRCFYILKPRTSPLLPLTNAIDDPMVTTTTPSTITDIHPTRNGSNTGDDSYDPSRH